MRFPIVDHAVLEVFNSYGDECRTGLLRLRDIIFECAQENPKIGPLHETLKWNQPAYLTKKTGAGSTIRLGCPKQGGFAIYAHCQTTIISEFKVMFDDEFDIEGNRAIHFTSEQEIQDGPLRLLISRALTYHL